MKFNNFCCKKKTIFYVIVICMALCLSISLLPRVEVMPTYAYEYTKTTSYSSAGTYNITENEIAKCNFLNFGVITIFNIKPSVSYIRFEGDPNRKLNDKVIHIDARTTDLHIEFSDMNLRGIHDRSLIEADETNNVYLHFYGRNKFEGGERWLNPKIPVNSEQYLRACNAISGNKLILEGNGSVEIIGGFGFPNAGIGGGYGIYANKATFYCDATIIGGHGSNGANGRKGKDAQDVTTGTDSGSSGGNGEDGMRPGIGGNAIRVKELDIKMGANITLFGGNGGNGGNGGKGGNGGSGFFGGSGGNGGNGGDAKMGYYGAVPLYEWPLTLINNGTVNGIVGISDIALINKINCGQRGSNGIPGAGGVGGKGGSGAFGYVAPNGTNGERGNLVA